MRSDRSTSGGACERPGSVLFVKDGLGFLGAELEQHVQLIWLIHQFFANPAPVIHTHQLL